MSWFLRQSRARPNAETAPMPAPLPAPGARMGAAFTSQWIEDDAWSRSTVRMNEVRDQIIERLGDGAPNLGQIVGSREAMGWANIDRLYTQRVLEAAAAAAAEAPGDWAGVPLSVEDFDAEVIRRRRAEYDEAQAVLNLGGRGLPAFLGSMAGGMTDPISLAMAPLGVGSLARGQVVRFLGSEAALGGASEAAIVPRAGQVAEDLDLPPVDPVGRVAMGALGGAALAGGMVGIARAWQYSRGAIRAVGDTRPEGVRGADHAAAVSAAETDLRLGRTPAERLASEPDALDLGATTLIATTGTDGQLRAMVLLPDGARITGLEAGATLPDGSRIASIEPGRITVSRDGQPAAAVEVGGTIGQPGRAYAGPPAAQPAPVAQPAAAQPPAPQRFDYSPGAAADPAINPAGYVFGRLIDLGYPPHIASGLTGNLMQESGPALNTRAVGDGGNAYGMGQWNGSRRIALYDWASARGLDVNDIETQVLFLHHELQGPENTALRAILAAPDAQTAARVASERFWRPGVPHVENRMGYAQTLWQQFEAGEVPTGGRPAPVQRVAALPPPDASGTGRSHPGEVFSPTNTAAQVRWEVVDLETLRAATGDLQPRDRTRAASDEQITDIAARLNPARLMPNIEADRGAPIVGLDDIVESGNGRIAALRVLADRDPGRFGAYVDAIRAQGFAIPEGVTRPALIGRRTSDMTPEQRVTWVRENNVSAIARMGLTEQARVDGAYLTQPVMDALRPASGIASLENRDFVRRFLRHMPQAERGVFYTADGQLTLDGVRRIQAAMFARAWGADDLLMLLAERPSADLRALVTMLEDLAPEWAAFRAMIQAGYVKPGYDITEAVTGMVRLIGQLRAADREKGESVADALREFLQTPDMFNPRSPEMDAALLALFYRGEQARRPVQVADVLRRYAAEAATAGRADVDDMFSAPPAPHEVMRTALRRQDAGEAMPEPPAPPARVAPEPTQPDQPPPALPEAPEGAASPDLARLADDTAEAAAQALEAPAAPLTERTEAGDQILMPGIAPITDADRLAARAAQPLDGGARASDTEIGGLFDPNAAARTDLFDAPAAPPPARPGTAARDELALEAQDYLALRDGEPFRLDEDGAVGTLADHLKSLDRDATLSDLLTFCTGKPA